MQVDFATILSSTASPPTQHVQSIKSHKPQMKTSEPNKLTSICPVQAQGLKGLKVDFDSF